ncbi:MAG TPA: hypothetical protein VGN07_10225 [Steroidobacteraceae bacterium]
MSTSLRVAVALLAGFHCCLAIAAEPICKPEDNIGTCWDRYFPQTAAAVDPSVSAAAAKDGEEQLKSFETGLDGGSAALATTTRNFLPLLSMAGLISDSDGNAEDNLFTIDLNFLIPGLATDKNAQLKAVLNTDPTLFAPLQEAIDTSGNAELAASLKSQLDAADDYTIAFAYTHINDRFGRSFKQYQRRFSNLFEAVLEVATQAGAASTDERSDLARLVDFLKTVPGDLDADTPLRDAPGIQPLLEHAAAAEASLERNVHLTANTYNLKQFAELVNNQPQLTFSAELRERDVLVGAKEKTVKVTYEFGLANVSQYEKKFGRQCESVANAADTKARLGLAMQCLSGYSEYIRDNRDTLRNADRFVAELSYADIDDYSYSQNGLNVARDGAHRLDFSVGYGRTLRALGEDRDSRLDLVAKYQDYSDDPELRDRMVTTLTFTTKVNGFSVPISLVYANHSEFLPDSDHELGAHIGIKFSLDSKED